ncbi:MAG: NAD-dependent epimerase/dehydratase family protein [candidate division KSB1 bacterium]|nr:NAD-dependent epimerase/dehydratase family protein [candidate division KSB1 bacterium]
MTADRRPLSADHGLQTADGGRVLVTGGAGFIGSHTIDLLLEKGYEVRILDNLQPRVHPRGKPPWVPKEAEFILGDVANPSDLSRALEGVDYVFHLAAYQDYMPDFSLFIHTNAESAALLFELVVSDRKRYPVRKIVFASSQAVCGEGRYLCTGCGQGKDLEVRIRDSDQSGRVHSFSVLGSHSSVLNPQSLMLTPQPRSLDQLRSADWDIHCPVCGEYMQPVLIGEDTVSPGTAYGISKYAIELLADRLGRRYGIPTVCMRYTYVQGPRNSFYNAYSGIARRFALRLLHGLPPIIYEDGQQLRDYVNVRDVARANVLVMEDPRADYQVFNVGGGRAVTVLEFARIMLQEFGSHLEPLIPGEFRLGDTRHTVSDISKLRALGWEPTIPVEQNVAEYVAWIREQKGTKEYLEEAEWVMREQGVVQKVRG